LAEQASGKQIRTAAPAEPLEFPPLIAPDLRELRPHGQKKRSEEDLEKEIALFSVGKLPPLEVAQTPVDPQKKLHAWQYLLTFLVAAILLLWLHGGKQEQLSAQVKSAASSGTIQLQASK
ncbi:hypothetical protein VU06_04165, partial [Desulfobulbus sp. F3]|nr:hypothetical protein [Desulfobulbus sp. F3]